MVEELVTPDDRIRALDALGALANAVHAEILEAVAVADVAKDWRADGATSMATRWESSSRSVRVEGH